MTAASPTHDEEVAKVTNLVGEVQVCMFTTSDATGRLVSRPLAVLKVEDDGDLWFVSDGKARKVDQVGREARVNVGFSSRSSWVSIAGDAEIVRDVAKTRELWGPGVSAWFPGGPEDPALVLVRVRADSAEYWDTPGAGVASVLSFVKSKVTGKSYDVENKKVEL